MDVREQADLLAKELGDAIGIEELSFDEDGTITLSMDKSFLVSIGVNEAAGAIVLFAPIPGTEGAKPPAFLEDALIGNFMWRGTHGATLAIDESSGTVCLVRELPLHGLDYPTFEKALERFVDAADAWAKLAEEHFESTGSGEAAASGIAGSSLPFRPDMFA